MALIPLDPPPGINSDDTSFSATGRWVDGSNVRFWENRPQVIGGWRTWSSSVSGTPRNLFAYINASTPTLICSTSTTLYDVTLTIPVSLGSITGGSGCTFGTWGSYLLAAPIGSGLKVWTGSGSISSVTQAPAFIGAGIVVVPQRQVLAFACNEEASGTVNRRCIRWSDLEDYTNWTTTATNNAGEFILDDPGTIVRALQLGDCVAVWTTASLFVGEYVGNPGQTWRFDRVATGCGLVAPFCVASGSGIVYWLTPDLRWMTWALGSLPEEIPCSIGQDFRSHVADQPLGNGRAFYNRAFHEVWLFYPDTRDTSGNENTRYIAFSTAGQGWFNGVLARSAAYDGAGLVVDTTSHPPPSVFMAERTTGSIYAHENWNGSVVNPDWYIQSADQYLDEGGRRVMVKGVRMDFKNQASDVTLTLYAKDRPQSTAVTKGPYTLTAAATKKDFRASGMLVAVKLSGTANNKNMRFGKLEFDTVALGGR